VIMSPVPGCATTPWTASKCPAVSSRIPESGRGANIALLRTPDGARQALTTFLHKDGLGGFTVSTYLKFRSAPPEVSEQLHLSALPGDLSERVDAVLKSTREIIDKDLLPALVGKDWPVVPVDWGDYK
jgi:hypothetical protein